MDDPDKSSGTVDEQVGEKEAAAAAGCAGPDQRTDADFYEVFVGM